MEIEPKPPDIDFHAPSPSEFITVSESDTNSIISLNKKKIKKCKRKHGEHNHQEKEMTENIETPIPPINPSQNSLTTQNNNNRTLYNDKDKGPFIVHIAKNDVSETSSIHPLSFGRLLYKNKINNVINGSLKKIARNKMSITFNTASDANNFILRSSLGSDNYTTFIPTFSICRMGVVKGIPKEWTDEEIVENISVPQNCGKVIKVRRLNYKSMTDNITAWKPSSTVVLTFDGQYLPNRIFICYNAVDVQLYIFPTVLCYNCCRFGHTKMKCRSKPRCFRCGQDHSGDSCHIIEANALCISCSGNHFASNRDCPELARQKNIKFAMAEKSVSYVEACKIYPSTGKSYSEVLKTSTLSSSHPPTPYTSTSYRKTVTIKPKSPPKPRFGYDQSAHLALTRELNYDYISNGSGLHKHNDSETNISTAKSNDSENIPTLINSLISILSSSAQVPSKLPSNVAPLLSSLFSLLQNGPFIPSKNNSMELPIN